MAQSPDTPASHMLFTEFDLSDKGRATPAVESAPIAAAPLPSIADLAATLDLDFEDDLDSPSSPSRPDSDSSRKNPESNTEKNRDSNNDEHSEPDDEPISKPSPPSSTMAEPSLRPIEPSTWEEFASGFNKGASSAQPWGSPATSGQPQSDPGLSRPARSATAILPNPAEYAAAHFHDDKDEDETPSLETKAEASLAEASPGHSIEAQESSPDPFAYTPREEHDDSSRAESDEPDFDILSTLDQIEDLNSSGESPDNEYNEYDASDDFSDASDFIDDWLDAESNGSPSLTASNNDIRRANWYEPPENETDSFAIPSKSASARTPRNHAGDELDGQSQPSGRSRSSRSSSRRLSGDTAIRMFSDMDMQEAWKDKIDSFDKMPDSGQFAAGDSDTRNLDLFSDLDLNTIWEEKSRKKGSSPTTTSGRILQSVTESTVILDKSLLADWLSEDFPGEELPDWLVSANRPENDQLEDARHSTSDVKSHEAPPEPSEEDELLISDLEDFLGSDDTIFPSQPQKTAPEPEDGLANSGSVNDTENEGDTEALDVPDDLTADADNDQRDLSGLDEWKDTRDSDPLEGYDTSDLPDSPPQHREQAGAQKNRRGKAGAAAGDASGEETGGALAVENDSSANGARTHTNAKGKGKGKGTRTGKRGKDAGADFTDDFLNDIDFNDESIDDGISAPVINDSDIDMPSDRGVPRPGTEEMQAIMGEGEFSDPADASPSDDDEPEADGPPADEVAVNPMDVFDNMDDMDFSDDFDDDMRSMLEEDEEEDGEALNIDVDGFADPRAASVAKPQQGLWSLAKYYAAKTFFRVIPARYVEKAQAMIAWHDNWWFYCDLFAAIIASASLAVIISYYLWYRE